MTPAFNDNLLPRVVERLKALADESRIRILLRLKSGEANVTTLARELGVNQPAVSKHLAVLRQAGLLECRKHGTQCVYAVRDPSIFALCSLVCDGVVRHLRAEHAALSMAIPFAKGASR